MEIEGKCTHLHAQNIQGMISRNHSTGGVRATVNGREAKVTVNTWQPNQTTANPHDPKYYLRAEMIRHDIQDLAAAATPRAGDDLQSAIDQVEWDQWAT